MGECRIIPRPDIPVTECRYCNKTEIYGLNGTQGFRTFNESKAGGNVEYCRGVVDTVRAQALSFGIPWQTVASQIRESLIDAGRGELLEAVARVGITP